MRFNQTELAYGEDIPRPRDLTNELSRQEEEDVRFILGIVEDYLNLHGKAGQKKYQILVPNRECGRPWARLVAAHVTTILTNDCGWDVKFATNGLKGGMISLSVPPQTDASLELDQMNLFTGD